MKTATKLLTLSTTVLCGLLLSACNGGGEASHATGLSTDPTGDTSHATGLSTDPTGESSHDTGLSTDPTGSQEGGDFTLYVKVPAYWAVDSARTGIYLWNETSGAKNADWPGEAMESLGNDMWKFTIENPNDYTNFIFNRISAADPITDWGAKTINLAIADVNLATPLYVSSVQSYPICCDPCVSGNWVAKN